MTRTSLCTLIIILAAQGALGKVAINPSNNIDAAFVTARKTSKPILLQWQSFFG